MFLSNSIFPETNTIVTSASVFLFGTFVTFLIMLKQMSVLVAKGVNGRLQFTGWRLQVRISDKVTQKPEVAKKGLTYLFNPRPPPSP